MDTTSDWPERASRCLEEHYEWRHLGGLISKQTFETTKRRLEIYVNPFLTSLGGTSPNDGQIGHFVDQLSKRGLSSPTCKQVLFLTRKVIEQAQAKGLLASMNPIRPHDFVRQKSIPRGGFRLSEYRALIRHSRGLAQPIGENFHSQLFARHSPLPTEFPLLVRFMVNSFIRPTDLKNICHKHIEVIRGDQTYLRLSLPESKRHSGVIVTMRAAVSIYSSLCAIAKSRGLLHPEAPLFYPYVEDRHKAMMAMDHHFRRVLEAAGLRRGDRGQNRTLYSLRHTAITFRLLYGQGIDLLTLARNARTSVQMIERFYASELTPEMNIDLIQSRRRRGA